MPEPRRRARRQDRADALRHWVVRHPVGCAIGVGLAALGAMAVTNRVLARQAERATPPVGRFLTIDGLRLHYLDRGAGPPLVLLHGNGSMIQDFASSGLIDMAAERYRVIVFDRPGYGHSSRIGRGPWTADAQARLVLAALARLGVGPAVVLGHSWGASVAVAMALRDPGAVAGLVLASGYYYPTPRVDMILASAPAIPVLGDVARHTVVPMAARLMWPALMRKVFGPAEVPAKFSGFPKEMALRPSQMQAEAAEAALLIPGAAKARKHYARLSMPAAIVAGARDRLIDPGKQSLRLHHEVAHSTYHAVPGAGHMVHQTHTQAVMRAIDAVARQGHGAPGRARGDGARVRAAGPENMQDPPGTWDLIDQQSDESFPASDPPGNY